MRGFYLATIARSRPAGRHFEGIACKITSCSQHQAALLRSRYIPKLLAILLAIVGMGWVIHSLKPYLYPNAHLGFIFYYWRKADLPGLACDQGLEDPGAVSAFLSRDFCSCWLMALK